MVLAATALPFGLRDVKIRPIDANGVVGASVDLPYSRTYSFSEAEEYEELRGDDQLVAARGRGAQINWSLESGGISLAAWKVLSGGVNTATGVSPNERKVYRKKVTDARPYFQVEGQAISDSGGDLHCVIYKCRATGDLEGEFSDGGFWLTGASGTAFPVLVGAEEGVLYDFIHNETAVAIT